MSEQKTYTDEEWEVELKRRKAERWSKLEQEGKDKAYEQNKPPRNDLEWLRKVSEALEEMSSFYDESGQRWWARFAKNVSKAVGSTAGSYSSGYGLMDDVEKCEKLAYKPNRGDCEAEGAWKMLEYPDYTWSQMWSSDNPDRDNLREFLRESDLPEGSGRKRCSHFRGGEHQEESEYMVAPHAINDIVACFHRTLEHYRDTATNFHKEGKCYWWK